MKRKISKVLVLNDILISDTTKASFILKNLNKYIYLKKIYSSALGYKKWGIVCKDGVYFYGIKSEYIFDISALKMIKNEN